MILAAATGFATAFSLILAIGAQNAFVLRQGILGQHVLVLCLICAMSDAVLIIAGVAGFGWIIRLNPAFPQIMAAGGALFLLGYGAMRFRAAWLGGFDPAVAHDARGLAGVVATGLALTWLNPHVYLDTLGLIGAVSTRFPEIAEKRAFALGAVTSSFVFFFSLGYGARLLAPVMRSAAAWRLLDIGIGIVMWLIAAGLIREVV